MYHATHHPRNKKAGQKTDFRYSPCIAMPRQGLEPDAAEDNATTDETGAYGHKQGGATGPAGAPSGAPGNTNPAHNPHSDPELARLIAAWPNLTDAQHRRILAIANEGNATA